MFLSHYSLSPHASEYLTPTGQRLGLPAGGGQAAEGADGFRRQRGSSTLQDEHRGRLCQPAPAAGL